MSLPVRQELFVQEYLIDFNATRAATVAGYSAHTACEQGSRLLRNVHVQKRVEEGKKLKAERAKISQDYVLNNLQEIIERCMEHEAVRDKEGNPIGEYKFNASGANKALELLGRHLQMFSDKIEVSVSHEEALRELLED